MSAYGGYAELQKGHGRRASVFSAVWTRRTAYLAGAVCMLKARATAKKIDEVIFDILNPQLSYSPSAT